MIHAKSLSSVIELADNPPESSCLGPLIPDALVLYIARVPGSRDVFLTTAKPLQKVVTAQDIQSSLYYIHLDSPDDEQLRENTNRGITGDAELNDTRIGRNPVYAENPIGTSPLSNNSDVPMIYQPEISPTAFAQSPTSLHNCSVAAQIVRKPIGHRTQSEAESLSSNVASPNARVMGPRVMAPHIRPANNPVFATSHNKENIAPRRWSEQPPTVQSLLQPRPRVPDGISGLAYNKGSGFTSNGYRQGYDLRNPDEMDNGNPDRRGQLLNSGNQSLSLTLIRRYNGSQKNVGTIFNGSALGSSPETHPPGQQDDISIQISTPGYASFELSAPKEPSAGASHIFERRLRRIRKRSQSPELDQNGTNLKNNRTLRMSTDFWRLSKPNIEDTPDTSMDLKHLEHRRPANIKGYGFSSPWNGTCEFSSGITGHALKCKHTPQIRGSQAVTVSELRFNLPSPSNIGAASPRILGSPNRSTDGKRPPHFSSRHRSEPFITEGYGRNSNDNEDTVDRFDLSLGQEHAGGGFGGKQAKLGKLIIEPEGLKMLDLVVAANMGLWWKAYERAA
ncbi:MAG: hypothetical protein Q9201_005629 [Fulgogasparrea decipioides]